MPLAERAIFHSNAEKWKSILINQHRACKCKVGKLFFINQCANRLNIHKRDKPCREKTEQKVVFSETTRKEILERQVAFAKQEINRTEQSGRGAGFAPGHDLYSVIPV